MSCAQARESVLSFKAKGLKLSLLPAVHVAVWTPGGPPGVFGHLCQPCRNEEARAGGVGCGTALGTNHRGTLEWMKADSALCDHVSWTQPSHLLTGSAAHRAAKPSSPGCPRSSTGPIPSPLLPDLSWKLRGGRCVLTAPSSWD